MSTQRLTELPRIQKTGMDFDSVMTEIRNIVNENPNWKENWNEFYDSEAGTMLCSLMAWVADNISSRQDLLYNEMFIGTAQDDKNKIRHLKQIGYIPKMAHSSKVPIKIVLSNVTNSEIYLVPEYKPGESFESRPSKFASFTGRDINGKTINWEILPFKDGKPDYKGGITLNAQGIEYTTNNKKEILYAVQGKTIYEEFVLPTNDGSYFDLKEKNIASDSIQVYKKDTGELLKEAKSFLTIINENKDKEKIESPYIIEMNESRGFRIRFAGKEFFDEKKLLKAGTVISVFYRVCDGALGNIKANYISQSTNFINADGDAVSANIYNELPAVEGANMESLDEAVKNGPTTLITMDRAVTSDDYDIVLSNNTNIFKTKTYTASNQPETFNNYYGRHINPQESFIFTLLNKQHEGVSTEQYNYFPWITTIKEPRLNEKYIFDNGNFNYEADLSNTLYNSKLLFGSEDIINFYNSTLIKLGSDFNSSVSEENADLLAVLTSKPTNEERLNNITFDILGNNYKAPLTIENSIIKNEDYARFILKESVDLKKPIDIKNAYKLTFVMNDEAEFQIDFSALFRDNFKDMKHAYLLWDNDNPGAQQDITSITEESAKHRKGIVQIINESVNDALTSIKADNKFSYTSSKQLFGLPKNIESNVTIDTTLNDFCLKIDDKTYKFTPPSSKQIITYGELVNFLNECFKNTTNVKLIVDGEETSVSSGELSDYEAIIYNNKYKAINSTSINDIAITSGDMAITKEMNNGKVINIKDADNNGLIHILGGNPPRAIPASDYKNINVASILVEDKENKTGRICIQTTYKGEDAKLFIKNSSIGGDDIDFGKKILKIPYINDDTYSPKVIGQRKIVLLKKDSSLYGTDTSSEDALKGNIIFQNSCMFNDYDFKKVYASYKLKNIDRILIGSNYNNYYYSGNNKADEVIKDTNIYGILGQVIYYKPTDNGLLKTIDMEKSNFNIKLTKAPKQTNSLFAIESDLDAVPSDYVKVITADINDFSGTLHIKIDETSLNVKINNAKNALELKNQIRLSLTNKKIIENFDHIFSTPFDNINKLIIKSIKKQNGSISFELENGEDYAIYENLFGTKESNSELYVLYKDLIKGKETYLHPENENPLVFDYRIIKDGKVRNADYYIQVEEGKENKDRFDYYLCKTLKTTFPNSFFYMHFVNDKTYSNVETDESILQKYMSKKIVSGTDITFLQPYFSTYDINIDIMYNTSFNETEVKNNIIKAINDLCGLKNAEIAGSMSKAKILQAIMNVNGVLNCNIKYFGYNNNDPLNYPSLESIDSDFYEISSIHETDNYGRGLSINLSHS